MRKRFGPASLLKSEMCHFSLLQLSSCFLNIKMGFYVPLSSARVSVIARSLRRRVLASQLLEKGPDGEFEQLVQTWPRG